MTWVLSLGVQLRGAMAVNPISTKGGGEGLDLPFIYLCFGAITRSSGL
jgi:hypothetical protein